MRIVLDTNILISILPEKSKNHFIYKQFLEEKFDILISNDILFEYREIIAKIFGKKSSELFYSLFHTLNNIELVNIYFKWNLISVDKDDNKFIDTYLSSQADFLVTEDKHFNHVKDLKYPKINIITLEEFSKLLKND
ncbi:MAG TPA: putative toxin-antitoxin system toxin component, PIN family [Ignavibacteria bacterium]|nr:putative toxin-antitoxin system toxin component, PIN family [Ignavibacteria bacterium]